MNLKSKILFCLILFAPYFSTVAQSNNDTFFKIDTMGVQLFAFCQKPEFNDIWNKPETPKITSLTEIKRGEAIVPYITFATDAADSKGNAFLTYDIKIIKPDSTVYADLKDLVVFKDYPAPYMHIVMQQVGIYSEEKDPLGEYLIQIVVFERNKNIKIPLTISFTLTE